MAAPIAFCFDVYCGDDVVEGRVAPILGRQIRTPQCRVITHIGVLIACKPRIGEVAFEVPQVVVSVDDPHDRHGVRTIGCMAAAPPAEQSARTHVYRAILTVPPF